MSRRRRPAVLHGANEFLKRTEEFHHFVSRGCMALVRPGTPHYAALLRLSEELSAAYCAISGEREPHWMNDCTTTRLPRPWER